MENFPAKMESRKLIRLGNSSFALALPKEWVDKSGLKKGDNVFIDRNGNGEIVISPSFKKNSEKQTEINIDGKDKQALKREFISEYIKGNSVFKFCGKISAEQNKEIKELISNFIGCEILKENEKEISIKDFFNLEEFDVVNFIRRMDNNIREMFSIITSSIEKDKLGSKELNELNKIDSDINKFYFLNSRIMMLGIDNPSLANMLKITPSNFFNNWWLSFHIEHTGDNLKNIAKKISFKKLDKKSKIKVINVLVSLKNKYENALKSFYSKDKEIIYKTMQEGLKTLGMCEELTASNNAFLSNIGEKMKEINNASYQIVKIVSYMI